MYKHVYSETIYMTTDPPKKIKQNIQLCHLKGYESQSMNQTTKSSR